ncbi:MAG TPA: YjbH domain-containing protein [Longimicrobium sp.]|nr:YjbH domain-containing protein [Longimicrobium sp.]
MRVSPFLFTLFILLAHPPWRPRAVVAQVPPSGAVPRPLTDLPPPFPADTLRSGNAESATRLLAGHGFANVAVTVTDDRVVARFENARFRDERRAILEAARLLTSELPHQELVLVAGTRGIPLVAVRFAGASGATATNGKEPWGGTPHVSFDVSSLPPALLEAPRASSSFGRLELVVHPWLEAQFGQFDNPVRSRLGVAPELRVDVRRGLALSAQVLFTLHDELHPGESRVRPGVATLNHTVRLPRNAFLSATVGTFTRDRYGADLEGRVFSMDGRLAAGAVMGLTGAAHYDRDGWRLEPMEPPLALLDVAGRIARYDLTLQATAGRFLDGDHGVRLHVLRRFGELEIGWFVLSTDAGSNGGLTLRIPLLPSTHAATGAARLRVADAFPWEYRYHALERAGRRYDTGSRLEELGRRFDPAHLAKPPGITHPPSPPE